MTTPTSDFYLTLPSNASTSVYPNNGHSGFKVTLLNGHELHGDKWQVGLACLIYPRTCVNMPGPTDEKFKELRHQGVFYARIFSRRRPARYNDVTKYPDERWVPFHVAQGHYETVKDFRKGRDDFGHSLADQEFKFAFDEGTKRVTITVAAWSCLALNPWMEGDTFGGFTITWRHFATWKKVYEQFILLGVDEYAEQITEQIIDERIIRARSDKVISWRTTHLAFQTIYIYSDVVASQVVGDVRANLLRVIAPKGSHIEVSSEKLEHLFYNDVRVKSFNTIEILLRGDTGRPIPLLGDVVEVTLHFRRKVMADSFLHGVTQQCQSTNVS